MILAMSPPKAATRSVINTSLSTIALVSSIRLTNGDPRLLQVDAVLQLACFEERDLIGASEADHWFDALHTHSPLAGDACRIFSPDLAASGLAEAEIGDCLSGEVHVADGPPDAADLALDEEVFHGELLRHIALRIDRLTPAELLRGNPLPADGLKLRVGEIGWLHAPGSLDLHV